MTFGLPNMSFVYQCNLRHTLATQEASHDAVLIEMEAVLKEPPGPPEPPEAQGSGGS